MSFHKRIWIPDTSSESKMYPDSVYMYDAGNFIGLLTQKGTTKQWSGFTVVSRVKNQETIEETLEPAHDYSVPMRFFSIESYPAKIESSILWIPGWKIQWQTQQPHEVVKQSDLPLPQSSSPRPPLKQQTHQQQSQPSPQPSRLHLSPSSQPLPKLPSGKQGRSQHSSQNKNNSASKPKASPSSNPTFHGRQRQSTPRKSGEPPSLSSPNGHIAQ